MSTQVVRLANGDSIQVRTGILRGAGPAGPTGPANAIAIGSVTEGLVASATISGTPPSQVLNLVLPKSTVPGPTGSVADYLTHVTNSSNISCAVNTDQILTFATVIDNDLNMLSTSTVFDPVPTGQPPRVLSFDIGVVFDNLSGSTAVGHRTVFVRMNGSTVIATQAVGCNPQDGATGGKTHVVLPVKYRFNSTDTFSVYARHSAAGTLQISSCYLRCIRVGAGPTGPAGPVGPAAALSIGTVTTLNTGDPATASVTGSAPNQVLNLGLPKGSQGVPGGAGSGYATIHELDGTGGNVA